MVTLRVLSAKDVNKLVPTISASELMLCMAEVFRNFSASKGDSANSPLRTKIETDAVTTLFMPSRSTISRDGGTAIKVVSVPKSGRGGLPATTLVMDEDNGAVKAVVNARELTALRNAAGSALVTKALLSAKGSTPTHFVGFGAGLQIYYHAHLLLDIYPTIVDCAIINRTANERLETAIARLETGHPNVRFKMLATASQRQEEIEEVVRQADIICTATSSTVPLFDGRWVKDGAHVNLIGSYTPKMREVGDELMRRASLVVVDSRGACEAEAGEIIHAGLDPDQLVEAGELVDEEGALDHSRSARGGDVTIFKSVGIGAQDVAVAEMVVRRAEEMGVGDIIEYD